MKAARLRVLEKRRRELREPYAEKSRILLRTFDPGTLGSPMDSQCV
jgi:hypothetical protein